ncbi:AsmA-like C-terminal region-containing protein [Tenacibaculum amylolyticum]|uniref:AsmA-like C-terminal region-containing protein n=1 Tax=Tenacibaculum amylolyticum TaxID=104269 RepID=UPI0038941ACA
MKVLITISIVFILGLIGGGYYLKTHKEKVLHEFSQWYHKHHKGTLTFDNISVNTFKHFPSLSFTIHKVSLKNSLDNGQQTQDFSFDEVDLKVSLKNLLRKKIQFNSLIMKNGKVFLFTDKNNLSNTTVFSAKKTASKKKHLQSWFSKEQMHLELTNVKYEIIQEFNHQKISGNLNGLNATVSLNDTIIHTDLVLNAYMEELGFNLQNGAFLKDTRVKLRMHPTLFIDKKNIAIPPFDIVLNDQIFKVGGTIYTQGYGSFDLTIKNSKTDYDKTVKLLPANIRKTLKHFSFAKPIHTDIALQGSFGPNSNPYVNVDFKIAKNNLQIKDSITIDSLDLVGNFISEESGVLKLHTKTLQGVYKGISFSTKKADLYSTASGKTSIQTVTTAKGNTKSLNSLLNNTTFLFQEGRFNLTSQISGNINNLDSLLQTTKSSFSIQNSNVLHKELGVRIAIDTLHLAIAKKDANLSILKIPLKENNIDLTGKITNVLALVFGKKEPVATAIKMSSEKIAWKNVTQLFNKIDSFNTGTAKQHLVINDFAKSIYQKFNPNISIKFKEFNYKDFQLFNAETGLKFKNENQIYLKNTGFDYRNGSVVLDANLDITDPEKTIFEIESTTSKLDFAKVVKDYDYFGIQSLQNLKQFTGAIDVNTVVKGVLNNDKGLDLQTLSGKIDFNIDSLSIDGFKPLEKVADLVFRKSRFENIRFAPISNTIYFKNKTVEIPRTEIQSTAFNLYVLGDLGFDNNTNLWISIPLSNLEYRNIKNIPKKVAYKNSGWKVFVQAVSNSKNEIDYKFRLSDRKLLEEEKHLNKQILLYKKDEQLHGKHEQQKRLKNRILEKVQ